jgi:hypothetical protein
MRVGFVRKAGLGAMVFAAAALIACNDDPLSSVDKGATTNLFVNPNAMVLPSGGSQKLESRAVNAINEPTFEEVLVNSTLLEVDAVLNVGCATVALDPDRTPIQPPGMFVVTGGAELTDCEFVLSSGGVEKTVSVSTAPGDIVMSLASPEPPVRAGETGLISAVLVGVDGEPVSPFDQETDCTWASSDTDIATVDSIGAFASVGPAGPAVISCSWTSEFPSATGDPQSISREGTYDLEVLANVPVSAAFAIGANLGVVAPDSLTRYAVSVYDEFGNVNTWPEEVLGITAISSDPLVATAEPIEILEEVEGTDLQFFTTFVDVQGLNIGDAVISGVVETSEGDLPYSALVTVLPFPTIESIEPAIGGPGTEITITGTGLGAPGWPPTVYFNGIQASPLVSANATVILVGAPTFTEPGDFEVQVVVGPLPSNVVTFTLEEFFVEGATEPNNGAVTAPSVTLPFEIVGTVDAGDLDDYFRVTLDRELDVDIFLAWDNANADLDILIRAGDDSGYVCSFDGATGANPEHATCTLDAGEYLFIVNNYNEEAAVYDYVIEVSNP